MDINLLIVDDEPSICNALRCVLRKEGYRIFSAQSALEALELLKEHTVDVVISDEAMPGIRGTEFLAQVKNLYPGTVRIMLTGKATLDTAVKAINDGAIYRFLQKPFDATDLKETIRQGLKFRNLCQQAYRLHQDLKMKTRELENMEKQHPGIGRVIRDRDGQICLNKEGEEDFESFMSKLHQQFSVVCHTRE